MYVSMYICMYVCMYSYVCKYVCMFYVCLTYVCMYVCVYVFCMCVCMYLCMYVCVFMYVLCMQVCTYVCIFCNYTYKEQYTKRQNTFSKYSPRFSRHLLSLSVSFLMSPEKKMLCWSWSWTCTEPFVPESLLSRKPYLVGQIADSHQRNNEDFRIKKEKQWNLDFLVILSKNRLPARCTSIVQPKADLRRIQRGCKKKSTKFLEHP
jgi:hypothetical protein